MRERTENVVSSQGIAGSARTLQMLDVTTNSLQRGMSMKRALFSSVIGVCLLVSAGCSVAGADMQDSVDRTIKVCTRGDGSCMESNCDELYQPYQGPGSMFGMQHPDWGTATTYKVVGFRPPTDLEVQSSGDKRWIVRGYAVTAGVHTYVEGRVVASSFKNIATTFLEMEAKESQLVIRLDSGNGQVLVVASKDLVGLRLWLTVPSLSARSRGEQTFEWSFASPPSDLADSWAEGIPIVGYPVNWETKGGVGVHPLCAGDGGAPQRAVFLQGQTWDPETFALSGSVTDRTVTVACELGAIASCHNWGYAPWTEGTRTADGQSADMTAVEQTCIRMKTADYCGTGLVHTQYGTQIVVNTPIEKVRHLSAQPRLEAIWNEHGAICVIDNNRRHQNMYYACDASIPQCDKDYIAKFAPYFMSSGLP